MVNASRHGKGNLCSTEGILYNDNKSGRCVLGMLKNNEGQC